ncbi:MULTISPECIES: DUF2706 domain-containing protein [unclassified Rickettsia]|jgi:hypothetical protein|uniref:DUF2706 domain-containing protein n=1 Tax=unclassified Rickettsia TaxID=114295 RepID=UPI0020A065E6|nr:DUF2706 domain-containing protein [Rickettsia endosymbiont of Ceutorhynchus assimilis]
MLRLLKLSISLVILLQLLSCTPSAPYEIKSPCVSAESNDLFSAPINPCVRRPVNSVVDIA